MAKNCNCAGSSCGCSVTGGDGIKVTGSGTAADPFVVAADITALPIANSIAVTSSTSIEFGKKGTGAAGDPVVIGGQVVVRSPNGTRWAPAVSDAGVGSWVLAGPAPQGSSSTGGITIIENEILYYDGTSWESRSSAAHVIWCSLGYTGVPVPAGFKKGDTWLCEAT